MPLAQFFLRFTTKAPLRVERRVRRWRKLRAWVVAAREIIQNLIQNSTKKMMKCFYETLGRQDD